jgi:hypothetical protein
VSGNVLTPSVSPVDGGPGTIGYDRSVRWIAASDAAADYVRVVGSSAEEEDSRIVYTLRYWDTTYTVPRWNASGGQATVVVVTSLAQAPVVGSIGFFTSAGALVHTEPLSLERNVPRVLSTASIPALAGLSGFALVAHTAGYGGLTGKAVALEPATGFTFDTALQPIAQ